MSSSLLSATGTKLPDPGEAFSVFVPTARIEPPLNDYVTVNHRCVSMEQLMGEVVWWLMSHDRRMKKKAA